jgi:hypothetical protein
VKRDRKRDRDRERVEVDKNHEYKNVLTKDIIKYSNISNKQTKNK